MVNIVSMIYVNGKWTPQEEVSKEELHSHVQKVIERAGQNIGFEVRKTA